MTQSDTYTHELSSVNNSLPYITAVMVEPTWNCVESQWGPSFLTAQGQQRVCICPSGSIDTVQKCWVIRTAGSLQRWIYYKAPTNSCIKMCMVFRSVVFKSMPTCSFEHLLEILHGAIVSCIIVCLQWWDEVRPIKGYLHHTATDASSVDTSDANDCTRQKAEEEKDLFKCRFFRLWVTFM